MKEKQLSECEKCGRKSEVVMLGQDCPFCEKNALDKEIEAFEKEFCNNHQKPIRFLRSVFYDEQDGAERIEDFLRQSLLSSIREARQDAREMMRKEFIEQISKKAGIGSFDGGLQDVVIVSLTDVLSLLSNKEMKQ